MIPGFVVLMVALGGATWIDVPFARQEKNGCGSASLWMLTKYWGKPAGSIEEIQRQLFSEEAGGIFASDMERFLSERGFQTVSFAGEWKDLTENIARGRPLIASMESNSRGTPLHYVLVVGVDESRGLVLLNDPAGRKLRPMARAEFEKRWTATNRWTLLAMPEGEVVPMAPGTPPLPRSEGSNPALDEAGVAFRAGDTGTAKHILRKNHLESDPLGREFLATLYFLEDNLEAALKHWNRNGSPQLREVQMDFETRWDPVLLDNTVGISRATVLRESDYVLARRRLDASETFSRYTFDLKPVEGRNEFDLSLRASEKPGWSPVGWLRGLPYQTVTPELTNLAGRAINVDALWRWDVNKRRVSGGVSGPLSPSMRYRASIDGRHEIWERNGQTISVRRDELHLGLEKIATHNWDWSSGAVVTRRPSGYSLKYEGSTGYELFRWPEKRLTVSSRLQGQAGREFSTRNRIGRGEGEIRTEWFPRDTGEDYHVVVRVRSGRVWGSAYLDELFSVGMDRDDDLQLRGHSTTRDGRKGAGLTGRRYVLWNSEISKTVFDKALLKVRVAPFADVARAGAVFIDAGAELRVSIASLATFSISVGRDLKNGRTLVFTNSTR